VNPPVSASSISQLARLAADASAAWDWGIEDMTGRGPAFTGQRQDYNAWTVAASRRVGETSLAASGPCVRMYTNARLHGALS
jgi:hypothetical protein